MGNFSRFALLASVISVTVSTFAGSAPLALRLDRSVFTAVSGLHRSRTLPLLRSSAHPRFYIAARVGKTEGVLIVDTGVPISVIERSVCAREGFVRQSGGTLTGLSGAEAEAEEGTLPDVRFGPVQVSDLSVVSQSLTAFLANEVVPGDAVVLGVLGADVMTRLRAKIDLGRNTISFEKQG